MSRYRLAVWGDARGREQDWRCGHSGRCQVADPALRGGHRVCPVRSTRGDGRCGTGHGRDFPAGKETAVSDHHHGRCGTAARGPRSCRGNPVTSLLELLAASPGFSVCLQRPQPHPQRPQPHPQHPGPSRDGPQVPRTGPARDLLHLLCRAVLPQLVLLLWPRSTSTFLGSRCHILTVPRRPTWPGLGADGRRAARPPLSAAQGRGPAPCPERRACPRAGSTHQRGRRQ